MSEEAGHWMWLSITEKQRECLLHLSKLDGPGTLMPFAAGTLSSLRKAGLVERVRVPTTSAKCGHITGYRITEPGLRALREDDDDSDL